MKIKLLQDIYIGCDHHFEGLKGSALKKNRIFTVLKNIELKARKPLYNKLALLDKYEGKQIKFINAVFNSMRQRKCDMLFPYNIYIKYKKLAIPLRKREFKII